MKEKAKIIATLVVCVVVLAAVSVLSGFWKRQQKESNRSMEISMYFLKDT